MAGVLQRCFLSLQVIQFAIEHAKVMGHYARAIRFVKKQEGNAKEQELHMIELYEKLGWTHAAAALRSGMPIKFPSSYQPF